MDAVFCAAHVTTPVQHGGHVFFGGLPHNDVAFPRSARNTCDMSGSSKTWPLERLRRFGDALWGSRAFRRLALAVLICWGGVQSGARGRAVMSENSEMSSFCPSGEGFEGYSTMLAAFGRQYVRREVRLTIQDAFAERHHADPRRSFVLGETGLRDGGKLWPHASHARGTSVDIFLPLVDAERAPVRLSHEPWNLWGYCHYFDTAGRYAGTRWEAAPRLVPFLGRVSPCLTSRDNSLIQIDFDETARLLGAIDRKARRYGLQIRAIIVTPEYLPRLLGSEGGRELGAIESKFVRRPVWIRHDEHVHIEFGSR